MQRLIALFLLIFSSPFLAVMYIVVRITSNGPFIFQQIRLGKDKKPFIIYKIRTMEENAEIKKQKLLSLNERTGPVFKIRNDPRFTKVGKILSRSGLDELPQLINILKGDMVFVGPRPFPIDESEKIPRNYDKRFEVLPGITSSWVTQGPDRLSFDEWMSLDCEYVKNKNWTTDLHIGIKTILLIIRFSLKI